MAKGEKTRVAILDKAVRLASELGLEGLSIGRLAGELSLSKSGLFAHFDSKEALQIDTLEHAREQFTATILRPALTAPEGEPRLRVLFERWLEWPRLVPQPGGCIFIAAGVELDDRPGEARAKLVSIAKDTVAMLTRLARRAQDVGHFRRDLDPEQFAFELEAIMLAFHRYNRLLRDAKALTRARASFERLIVDARVRS